MGYPDYYPRFGFVPAADYGITSEFEAPPEAFMARELREGTLRGLAGVVHFHPAFSSI